MNLGDVRARRDDILEIAARHGAYHVRLFGSVARGDDGPESDVDFLVVLEEGRSLLDQAGLMRDLEEHLSCKVDVAEERGLKHRIRDRVLQESVPL
ncbi:MAG: nucleotidyltransferase family protein [Armatimonadetes bacterium]|nr:nucleotidyltransferase family protein [Armatimonadota bacterium]